MLSLLSVLLVALLVCLFELGNYTELLKSIATNFGCMQYE